MHPSEGIRRGVGDRKMLSKETVCKGNCNYIFIWLEVNFCKGSVEGKHECLWLCTSRAFSRTLMENSFAEICKTFKRKTNHLTKYEIIPILKHNKQKLPQNIYFRKFPHACFFMRKWKSFPLNYCEISQKLLVLSLIFVSLQNSWAKPLVAGFYLFFGNENTKKMFTEIFGSYLFIYLEYNNFMGKV